jgi:hypothetical protein
MIVHRVSELCEVRPEWLKESGALNVEQPKLKVLSKKRDASFARKLLA